MNLDLPGRAVAAVAVFFAVSLALLLFMLARLGGLPLPGPGARSVGVVFANADGIPVQADVLIHGVNVGSVASIDVRPSGTTLVTLALDSSAPSLHPDASAAVGSKTPLGEPFLDLDPGHAPGRLRGQLHARSTVEIDDALAFLDPSGRASARSVLRTLARGAAPAEISGSIAALEPATEAVARLTAGLGAQRDDIASIISGGRVVLDALANRAGELSVLTTDARTALSAVAQQRTALATTLGRLPGLLSTAQSTLTDAKPLIERATPLVAALSAAAPTLAGALRELPPAAASLERLLAQTPGLSGSVLPALALLRGLGGRTGLASTALGLLGPTLADMVPVAEYLGPRGRTIAAWFANTADLGSHGDAKGDWARFFVMLDPATLTGTRAGAPPGNAYTPPDDAAHNRPYQPGEYPRLAPYWPALGHGS